MATQAILYQAVTHVKVNGSNVSEDLAKSIVEITVEQSVHLPAMLIMRLSDMHAQAGAQWGFFQAIQNDSFPIGGTIEVDLGQAESPETVFKGEITALEIEVEADGVPTTIVRGFDRAHRLHRERQNKSYLNVADSDVASKLASDAGLSASTDPTSPVHDYLYQNNQTHWEFLKERAARIGYEVFVDDRTLHFRKPQKNQSMAPDVKLFDNLQSLRVKMSSAFQPSTVIVRGWDPQTKQAIVGTASNGHLAPDLDDGTKGAPTAQEKFGETKHYVVHKPVASQDEADKMAQAVYDGFDGRFVQAEGTCRGNPAVAAGKTVKLDTISPKLNGKYYVTAATHRFDLHGGYTTSFVVSGHQSSSLLDLIEGDRDDYRLPSVVVGVVTNNTDDKDQGRVKVKLPYLGDNEESWWARIASPMAGSGRGFFFLPEVGDEVLVAFEHGDLTRPYILGALWNGQDAPPKKNSEAVGSSKVNLRTLKTRAGHVVTLDDTDGSEKISIVDKTGKNQILIEASGNKITIQCDGDMLIQSNTGKIDVKAQQDVTVTTQAKAVVNAQADVDVTTQANAKVTATGDVKVNATGNVDVEATANATVKATGNATVQATGNLDLKGAMVNLEGQGSVSIKSSGMLSIQGSMVSIN